MTDSYILYLYSCICVSVFAFMHRIQPILKMIHPDDAKALPPLPAPKRCLELSSSTKVYRHVSLIAYCVCDTCNKNINSTK